jgi:hypothetical protein
MLDRRTGKQRSAAGVENTCPRKKGGDMDERQSHSSDPGRMVAWAEDLMMNEVLEQWNKGNRRIIIKLVHNERRK